MKQSICKVCNNPFTPKVGTYKKNGKTYPRTSKAKTCSKECADYARGISGRNRQSFGGCSAPNCNYIGLLLNGAHCRKHYQYNLIHGYTEPKAFIPKPIKMDEKWKTWLAAYIDGEGCITVNGAKKPNKTKTYSPSISVGSTDKVIVYRLLELTNLGNILLDKVCKNPNAKIQHAWYVNKYEDVMTFLVTIHPYLIIKTEQAETILSFPPKHSKNNKMRKDLYAKIRQLNKRGR